MSDAALPTLTQGVFLFIVARVWIDFARDRDRARLEVAALFTALSATLVLQNVAGAVGLGGPWVGTVGTLALLAHPYVQLRLVGHFRPVPPVQRLIGLAGLLGSWAVVLVVGSPLPPAATLAAVAAAAGGQYRDIAGEAELGAALRSLLAELAP